MVLVCATTMLVSCSRDPNVRKQKYLESGKRYFEKAKYPEAAIQFRNAIQVDGRFTDAHYQLAQTYIKLQQWIPAYQELTRTLDLQPDNYPAHRDAANLLIAGRNFKLAQEHIDVLLEHTPNDPELYITIASMRAAQTPPDVSGAIEALNKAIALDPKRADSYINLAFLQANSNPAAAEANLKKAEELEPNSLNTQMALGGFYQAQGRYPEAEEQFRRAVQSNPKETEPWASLARLLLFQNRKAEAEALLKDAKKNFPDNSVGYRMLGDFYFATSDLDKATAEYSDLFSQHPKDIEVRRNYVQLLIVRNRLDEANKINEETLKVTPNDPSSLVYRGQILIRKGQPREASQALEAALKNDPGSRVAHYHLGIAYDQLGNLERAEGEWQQAAAPVDNSNLASPDTHPELPEAHRALALAEMRKGEWEALEQTAGNIIRLQPASPDGYVLRSTSYINRQEYDRAEADIQKAIQVAPQAATGYIHLGTLRLVQKKYPDADKAFTTALAKDPASSDAMNGLMRSLILQNQPDKAIAAVNAQITKEPNSSAFYDLLGTALFELKKDYKAADSAFRKSIDLDKNNSDALLKLGQVQVAEGSVDAALQTYQNSLHGSPEDVKFYILMGELYESKKDWTQAKNAYQKALELQPENALASNNLSYVILQTGGNIDVALSLAQVARRGMPESANAADTLGWVYYQKGAYQSAIDLFQEALKLNERDRGADDPTYHYHLALAYAKTNQPALARQHLERVLKIDPNYSNVGDVRKMLQELKT
jgi:tetratricopeptide (TPR) repeat protein